MDYKDYLLVGREQNLHFWYRARKNLIGKIMNRLYPSYSPSRLILDIGCGTGTELVELKNRGEVLALDCEREALTVAEKTGAQVLQADIEIYDLEKSKYDCICCFDVLEHLVNDVSVVAKIFNSLKKDSYFVFTVPAFSFLFSSHDLAMGHQRRYSYQQINNILKTAGFKNIQIFYWNTLLFIPIVIIRLLKKINYKIRGAKNDLYSDVKTNNGLTNKIFFPILNFENKLLFKRFIPFGLTIYGTAQKK